MQDRKRPTKWQGWKKGRKMMDPFKLEFERGKKKGWKIDIPN